MQTLTELLIDTGFKNRLIVDTQLARLISGTPQRRHSLVNRALKAGELLRLRRGARGHVRGSSIARRDAAASPARPRSIAARPGSHFCLGRAVLHALRAAADPKNRRRMVRTQLGWGLAMTLY